MIWLIRGSGVPLLTLVEVMKFLCPEEYHKKIAWSNDKF